MGNLHWKAFKDAVKGLWVPIPAIFEIIRSPIQWNDLQEIEKTRGFDISVCSKLCELLGL